MQRTAALALYQVASTACRYGRRAEPLCSRRAEPLGRRHRWPSERKAAGPATPIAHQRRCFAAESIDTRDPYAVLGLERFASKQQVQEAYHALALRWHPDRNPNDPAAEDHFKQVSAAYQALRRRPQSAGGHDASQDFAQAAGMTREEADRIFKEVFGSDTLEEMGAVFDLAESLQQRAYQQIREKHPEAERAMQQLVMNASGTLVVRTVVRQRGQVEVHEHEVSAEEAEQLAKVGLGVLRIAGLAARDVTTKLANELGSTVSDHISEVGGQISQIPGNISQGLFNTVAGGVQSAGKLAAPFIPTFAHSVLPDLDKLIHDNDPDSGVAKGGKKVPQ